MRGHEPALLQVTQEWVAQAPLAEELPLPLPKPPLLTAQIQKDCRSAQELRVPSSQLQGQRE